MYISSEGDRLWSVPFGNFTDANDAATFLGATNNGGFWMAPVFEVIVRCKLSQEPPSVQVTDRD